MEIFSSKIKKLLISSQKKKFFLYFGKWNFLALTVKNFLYFRKELSGLEKLKKITLKKFLIFWEMELSSLKIKNFLIFFQIKNLLYFRRRTCKAPSFLYFYISLHCFYFLKNNFI